MSLDRFALAASLRLIARLPVLKDENPSKLRASPPGPTAAEATDEEPPAKPVPAVAARGRRKSLYCHLGPGPPSTKTGGGPSAPAQGVPDC